MNWKTCSLFTIVVLFLATINSGAQDWRDLKPGKSKCLDVTKLFGGKECPFPVADYELPDKWVNVTFSGNRKDPVVKHVTVGFSPWIRLKDFEENLSQYALTTGGTDVPDAKSYNDDARGFGFVTRDFSGETYVTSAVLYLAQTPIRIKFRRGAISADVTGTLNSFNSIRRYVIRVRDGQTIRTEQVGGKGRPITISLTDPNDDDAGDSDASCNNRHEFAPTRAGDYQIEVIECRKAEPWRGRFTFRVTVR